MLGEVLTILLLTILFTFSTLLALLIRRILRGGLGQVMYLIWLAVILSAVIPLQIAPPVINVIISERTVTEVQPPYRDQHPEIMLITGPSHEIRQGELPVLRAHLYASDEAVVSESGSAVAFNVSGVMVAGIRLVLFVWSVGFFYCLIRELIEYREIRRYLNENSDPVVDLHQLEMLDRCRKQIGLRRFITLRRIREDTPITPCVIGFGRSTVYLSAFCDDMDSSHVENIFTHELCHVKRGDMLYKLLMVLAVSVHWFNPISRLFRDAVTEDLEMACDATVLRHRNATAVREYMEAILCVAERLRWERKVRRLPESMFRAAFFMANDTTPSYLKRRYLHMKTTREKKNQKTVYSVCAGVLALIAAANVVVLSSCSYVEAADEYQSAEHVSYLCDPVETAFANHFYVPAYSDIAEEQFAQIETIDVYLLTPEDDASSYLSANGTMTMESVPHNCVLFVIDGGSAEYLMPQMLTKAVYENDILPQLMAFAESQSRNSTAVKKFQAFYTVKDPTDPAIDLCEAEIIEEYYPITKETPLVLYDPVVTVREDNYLYSVFYEAGLVKDTAFSEAAIRAKLATIPALEDAEIRVYTASDINAFDVDPSVFAKRGDSYREQDPEYCNSVQENEQQSDLNGNGIVGS